MQASIMPSRHQDSMQVLAPLCRSPESKAGAADLLSQCTTEWSRYFIASRISGDKYTAALVADLSPQQQQSQHKYNPASASYRRISPSQATALPPTTQSPKFSLADDVTSSSSESVASECNSSPRDSPSPLRKVASCAVTAKEKSLKRVQFADEVGQALTRVRFLSDPSHLPVDPEIYLNGVNEMTSQSTDFTAHLQQQTECKMQLKCKFNQPSARYIMFRESVERNLVCLSLVHLDFNTIRGAIAVKNVSFRKRVFARITLDFWRSFRDVDATYNGSEGQQDNFTFSVQCPSDQVAEVQFCVCFECDSGTYWDSNGGENYRIAVTGSSAIDCNSTSTSCSSVQSRTGYTRDFKPNYGGVSEFSEFSAWEHFTDRVYY